MSKVNAPQPDAGANSAAEVFDSTIVPPMGEVSQDQLPGPNNSEAPMHTGEANGIDPFLMIQFIALTSFIWDTSMAPGQLVWSIPIHPSFCHVFLAHLSKMYNAYAGGIVFGITVAGTGFHAGKLLIVRLPPNIEPKSITRISDATAFPYYVIDPKTLEVIVKSAMDQRNVMYHYLPFKANDMQSFGGYIAAYVLLPLNTSATGATQISVQIFTKPAPNFMFTQLRPLTSTVANPYRPELVEKSLDFTTPKTSAMFQTDLVSMTCYTAKEIKELTTQTQNCVKLDGTPMNGEILKRFELVENIKGDRFDKNTIKSFNVQTAKLEEGQQVAYQLIYNTKNILSFDGIAKDNGLGPSPDNYLPKFFSKNVILEIPFDVAGSTQIVGCTCVLREKDKDDEATCRDIVLQYKSNNWDHTLENNSVTFPQKYLDQLIASGDVKGISLRFNGPIEFDVTYKAYAPPIPESVITFQSVIGDTAQPYELLDAILLSGFKNIMTPRDSLIFELIDNTVDLPLIPIRLHYDGYFSTINLSKTTIYKFEDPKRYSFKFLSMLPETTPMVGSRLPIQSAARYAYNQTVSQMSNFSLPNNLKTEWRL